MKPISPEVKKEYEAQAQAYFTAMRDALYAATDTFETPISNAAMTALVALMAERLAAVPDGRIRKQMKRDLDQLRDQEINKLISKPDWQYSEMATLGGRDA
ncbi:hypothetical protein SAMN04515647_4409 [Cohaesibacter sp. ES.047]|uniref:hypothetical protein n=1 Tax=Cohaesibacter sp. ES.047 TaxID=1798205 RepID=UPI000BB78144|nr:hypothetical protein [Cohaesibacter sp. ES.047]SNY94086.1 hypothetical protein SAMN04515647_4409 [Cohaesibacter sp. ES.047]